MLSSEIRGERTVNRVVANGDRTTRTKWVKVIDLSSVECPACHRTDQWDAMRSGNDPHHNPSVIVQCDCGRGEVEFIVE